jgi:hypothetical protein
MPPKADVPFLLHAARLIEVESGMAQQETRKDDEVFAVPGAASPVRTPVPEPIFLFLSEKIPPRLDLYRFDTKSGRREVVISKNRRKGSRPLRVTVTRVTDRLYRIEAGEILEPGEYALTPEGSNAVFCFSVY